ncbi:hypothetical protein ACEPPN_002217 [Leptodophora sp. 'Broadleaf-Isolate-01']
MKKLQVTLSKTARRQHEDSTKTAAKTAELVPDTLQGFWCSLRRLAGGHKVRDSTKSIPVSMFTCIPCFVRAVEIISITIATNSDNNLTSRKKIQSVDSLLLVNIVYAVADQGVEKFVECLMRRDERNGWVAAGVRVGLGNSRGCGVEVNK